MPAYRALVWLLSLAAVFAIAGCNGEPDVNFSQYPGFAAWYRANPPRETLPSAAEQKLLQRYRPRIFVADGGEGPISFYGDYIAHGTLTDGDGIVISRTVTQEILNAHKSDPHVVFVHDPPGLSARPVVVGRLDYDAIKLPGSGQQSFTFLTYSLIFRASGLPAGLPWWLERPARWLGAFRDWHQLDHYTAVTIALRSGDEDRAPTPVAATFQQHNYMRTYLLGKSDGPGRLRLPADGRIAVDVALASNELYPHRPGRTLRRAVGFMRPESARYLVLGEDPPFPAVDDVTDPAREVDYRLEFLAPDDAFYTFAGFLGERRWLPGRDGPPGADYNTLPVFKPKAVQMVVFYWHEGDQDYLDALERLFAEGRPRETDVTPFAARFARDLADLR